MAIDPYPSHKRMAPSRLPIARLCWLSLCLLPAIASHSTAQSSANPSSTPTSSLPSFPSTEQSTGSLVDPNELVLKAIQQIVWGHPFACRVQQQTTYDDRTTTGQGQYLQAGHGSCQFKFHMRLGIGDELQSIYQVCDGRMLWTSMGEDQPYRTVNVTSVRQEVATLGRKLQENPEASLYLAIGGQAEVLRSLYMHYRWHKAYAVSLDDVPVWQLIGSLRTEPPRIRADAPCDQLLPESPQALVPQEVRLTLSRESQRPLFPHRIEYFIRKPAKDRQGEVHTLFSTLEYFELNERVPLEEATFQTKLQENIHGREDETRRYLRTPK